MGSLLVTELAARRHGGGELFYCIVRRSASMLALLYLSPANAQLNGNFCSLFMGSIQILFHGMKEKEDQIL